MKWKFLFGFVLVGAAWVPGFGQTRLSIENHSDAYWYLRPKQEATAHLVCIPMGDTEPSYAATREVGPVLLITLPPKSVIRIALLGLRPRRAKDLKNMEVLDATRTNPFGMTLAARWNDPLQWKGAEIPNVGKWETPGTFVVTAPAYPGAAERQVEARAGCWALDAQAASSAPAPPAPPEDGEDTPAAPEDGEPTPAPPEDGEDTPPPGSAPPASSAEPSEGSRGGAKIPVSLDCGGA